MNKHTSHSPLHSTINQLSAGFLLMGSIWYKGIFRSVNLITEFLLNLSPSLAQCAEGTVSSQQPEVPPLCTETLPEPTIIPFQSASGETGYALGHVAVPSVTLADGSIQLQLTGLK